MEHCLFLSIVPRVETCALKCEQAINSWMSKYGDKFDKQILLQEEDYPLEYYNLFKAYSDLVEHLLETFVQEKGVTVGKIGEACQTMQERISSGHFTLRRLPSTNIFPIAWNNACF